MPMPVSATVSVFAFLFGRIRIFGASPSPISSGRAIAELVAGVGGVRDQLAQEDIGLRIDRMHHQVQQFGDLGLKGLGQRRCIGHRHTFAQGDMIGKTSI
jgi:hypothetical protein